MSHVSKEEMFSLADGDLVPKERERIIKHISSCEECKSKISSVLSFNEELRRFWTEYLSTKCLGEETLFSFLEGKLKGDQLAETESHLSVCPVCRHKVESARESLDAIERLESAREDTLPSLIKRFKKNLGKIDVRDVLEGLEKILVPSRLGEELFALLSRRVQVLSYPFTTPLEVPALLPVSAGGVKLADTGKGFQRKIVTEEGTPFEVEMVQFGERFTLNLNTADEAYGEALVRYSLLEGEKVRHQGVLLVSRGKATVSFREEDIETLRPEKSPLKLRLQVLLKGDVVSKFMADDVFILLERLQALLLSKDPEITDAALGTLKKIEALIPE